VCICMHSIALTSECRTPNLQVNYFQSNSPILQKSLRNKVLSRFLSGIQFRHLSPVTQEPDPIVAEVCYNLLNNSSFNMR
jgi:hypothetical protein